MLRVGDGSLGHWLQDHTRAFLIVAGVFLVGCVAGTVAAFVVHGPDDAVGPLSEWVPGTVTALALTYTLVSQRQAAQERRDQENERQATSDRSQAEHIFTWIEREQDTLGTDVCVLRWSNTSDAPAYSCMIHLVLSDDTEAKFPIGSLPPQQHLGKETMHSYKIPVGVQPAPQHRFPVGVGCEFRDAGNRVWRRDSAGVLSRIS